MVPPLTPLNHVALSLYPLIPIPPLIRVPSESAGGTKAVQHHSHFPQHKFCTVPLPQVTHDGASHAESGSRQASDTARGDKGKARGAGDERDLLRFVLQHRRASQISSLEFCFLGFFSLNC